MLLFRYIKGLNNVLACVLNVKQERIWSSRPEAETSIIYNCLLAICQLDKSPIKTYSNVTL